MADKNRVYYGEYTLQHWIDLMLTENIVLPPYQRLFVWDKKQSQGLVDALIDNQFVPPVTIGSFFHDGDKMNLILDGQQRLTSLLLYYFNLFPKKEIFKAEIKEYTFANENDDENDDEVDFINWNFKQLLEMINDNGLRDRDEIHDLAIKSGYEDFDSSTDMNSLKNSYLGFSFIVPSSDDKIVQQKFYSKVFRSINIEGKKLLPLESREALYYLNNDLVEFFAPEFAKKITVNDDKMDFVRCLSILTQYHKDGGADKIARGFTKNMESYYENFIYAVVDEKETKEFTSLSKVIPDMKYKSRMGKLDNIINGLGLLESHSSIIKLDSYMFGLVYITIFENKTIDKDKYEALKNEIDNKIAEFMAEEMHHKNPSALKHLKLRVQESIRICEGFAS